MPEKQGVSAVFLGIALLASSFGQAWAAHPEQKKESARFIVRFSDVLTPDDARNMSLRAADLVNEKGRIAVSEFAQRGSGFLQKDGYVFCMSMTGVMLSHPLRSQLVGQNLYDYSRYGSDMFRKMITVAASDDGEGWVDYKWPYPGTNELRMKKSYVVRNKEGFFCAVTAFE